LGFSLSIIWVGIPILLLAGAGWWALASFERFMVVHWLHEDLPPMSHSPIACPEPWTRFKENLANPVSWKSLFYLLMKFPLGMAAFVV
jgi:two-component system phosphate regulon sensor histidine kinase PhoR